jgi:protein-disulfide isomerase
MEKKKPSSSAKNPSKKSTALITHEKPAELTAMALQTASADQGPTVKAQKKGSWLYWLGGVLILVFGLGIGWMVWGPNIMGSAGQIKIDPNLQRYTVPVDGYPSVGPVNAPITLVEFSDYQCQFCEQWYKNVYSRLMNDYKGKIRFVYRDFPLYAIHPEAQAAAEAADCAGEQNAYWYYHDALFNAQYGLGPAAYVKYALDIGLKPDQFTKCLSDRKYKANVEANVSFASSLGVSSTPTFFLNGMAIVGAQPYDVFQQIIDKELAGEIKK